MATRAAIRPNRTLPTRQSALDAFADGLRAHRVAAGNPTLDDLGDALGRSRDAVAQYLTADAEAGIVAFARLAAVGGSAAVNPLLALAGLRADAEAGAAAGEARDYFAAMAHLGGVIAALGDALADGRIDHVEAYRLLSLLGELDERLGGMKVALRGIVRAAGGAA